MAAKSENTYYFFDSRSRDSKRLVCQNRLNTLLKFEAVDVITDGVVWKNGVVHLYH
jgi:hypothetical protein